MHGFRRALVSVSDKSGLVEFLEPWKGSLEILSTGGTAKYLREQGFKVIDVSAFTGFPEVLDGRVKTLHPKVYMGILARPDMEEHRVAAQKHEVPLVDLVVVNLYPFEEMAKKKSPWPELIENIDIGGPSLLRASAKNYSAVTVVCDPADYLAVQKEVLEEGETCEAMRLRLALKVFETVSRYDSLIFRTLRGSNSDPGGQSISVEGDLVQELRYGENPQQKAKWYSLVKGGLHEAQRIQGKELSYNNVLDLDAALSLVREFDEPVCVAVKHNNPCGVATAQDPLMALQKALSADPKSVFGGILALNFDFKREYVDLIKDLFLECVMAPGIDDLAREELAKKKNLRVLEWKEMCSNRSTQEFKSVDGGFLVQDKDLSFNSPEVWKVFGPPLTDQQKKDLIFGEKVCGSLKSNAIAVVKEGQSLGLGMGQVNRVDAVEQALRRWRKMHPSIEAPALVSDAFFPFRDSIDLIAQSGLKLVLQPGGSVRDEEVIAAAQEHGIQLVLSGRRHFRH